MFLISSIFLSFLCPPCVVLSIFHLSGFCLSSLLLSLQDTEFPGIVARPTGNVTDYNYQTVKYNVDLLKVIQLGITFADAEGNLAEGTCTWQFNFRFDLNEDMYAQDSIDFLKQSGIDFDKQQKKGIDVQDFGELIMSSGLVMNEEVKWISFHGCYDFGYLLKLLTCAPLPQSESQFFELLHEFFPSLYDIKYLLRSIHNINLSGGSSLQKIAEHLQVTRVGPQHQAGSDSLVTCRTFFKLVELYFDRSIEDRGYSGVIYGLGLSIPNHHHHHHHLHQKKQRSPLGGTTTTTTTSSSHSAGGGGGGIGGASHTTTTTTISSSSGIPASASTTTTTVACLPSSSHLPGGGGVSTTTLTISNSLHLSSSSSAASSSGGGATQHHHHALGSNTAGGAGLLLSGGGGLGGGGEG